ncbi:MAG: hypothetical protein D8M59_10180 [Planctomycetes bacterium]|nr:hypothetical protein [Planctomycetota bacterium]NOG55210.1 hypothetical protein [Planctomycetota bacterium]
MGLLRDTGVLTLILVAGVSRPVLAWDAPDLSIDQAQFAFEGRLDGDHLGRRAKSIGDVDGDGFTDLIVTSRFGDGGGTDSGEVYIYSGRDGSLMYEYFGDEPYDELGHRLAVVGDVTGDDRADIVIGAFAADVNGQTDVGRVYLYDGRDGDLIKIWTGEAEGDNFGFSLASCGDLDHDNYNEIVVGAPYNDENGNNAGSAYVISLKRKRILYTYYGNNAGDNFGMHTRGVGDVNRDGYDDFGVGAPGYDSNGNDAGRLYVYSGKSGSQLFTFDGEKTNARLADRFEPYDDINDDGRHDILVSASTGPGLGTDQGVVYVVSGRNGNAIYKKEGEEPGDQFGLRILGGGDMDRDGVSDFIAAAPFSDVNGYQSGRVYVFSGDTGALIMLKSGERAGDQMGRPLGGLWDVNGDGYADLVVGAQYNDGSGEDAGRVYAFSGRSRTTLFLISGEQAGGHFGYSVSSADDLNRDGLPDFCVGSPTEVVNGHSEAGRAYAFCTHPVYLGTTPFTVGKEADVTVTGADAGEDITFYASLNGIGEGPPLPGFGGIVADLLSPVFDIDTIQARDSGEATLTVTVPGWLKGRTVYWQAFARRGHNGNDSVKSNTHAVTVSK